MTRNRLLPLLGFVLLAGLGPLEASVDPLQADLAKEMTALAGIWRPTSAENNGYAASAEDLNGMLWIRDTAGKWTLCRGEQAVVEWKVKGVDATKNPKTTTALRSAAGGTCPRADRLPRSGRISRSARLPGGD